MSSSMGASEILFGAAVSEIGSEHGKSVFHLLTKVKSLPSLEAQKDMISWNLKVKPLTSGSSLNTM